MTNEALKKSKICVIVESPHKCKNVEKYLKAAGYSNVKVVASKGHIMKLADGGKYHNTGINPDKDFELNLKISEDKFKEVENLKAVTA